MPSHPYAEQFSPSLDLPYRPDAERFVLIASTPRSGSTFLGHMLMETGEFGVPMEYLNQGNLPHWKRRFGTDNQMALFQKFIEVRTSPNGTFCLKAHWTQYKDFIPFLETATQGRGIERVVWIYRRNLMSQAVSLEIARQTGAWISGAPEKAPAKYNYTRIAKAAKELRNSNQAWQDYLEQNFPKRYLPVAYEDLVVSDHRIRAELGSFLDYGKDLSPPSRTKKQAQDKNNVWKEKFLRDLKLEDRWIIDHVHPDEKQSGAF